MSNVMRIRAIMRLFGIVCSLFFSTSVMILVVAGCNDSTDPVPESGEDDPKNPNSPTANQLITGENIFGDPEKKSSVWDMDGNQTEGFYCEGLDDFVLSAGLLTGTGTSVWQQPLYYQPRDILKVQTDGFSGAVAVGAYDSDEDGLKDQGVASLIDADGNIQDQLAVSDAAAPIWFNAVTMISDSLFLCVGGAAILDTKYPLLSVVYLGPDTTLQAGSSAILGGLPDNFFTDVEIGGGIINVDTGRIAVDCFVNGKQESGEESNITLRALRCPIDSLANTEIFWSRDIIAYPGLNTSVTTGNSLALAENGMLYIAGKTDVNKDPSPASGGYWSSGLVASVSTAGDVNWIKPIVLSQYSDYYNCVYATDDGLYAAGRYSSFMKKTAERLFGYGLLSKFDLTTGNAAYHLSFGDEQNSSGFNTLHVEGSSASVGGWAHRYLQNGGYQSWFAAIDLSSPPRMPMVSSPAEGPESATVSKDDHNRAVGH